MNLEKQSDPCLKGQSKAFHGLFVACHKGYSGKPTEASTVGDLLHYQCLSPRPEGKKKNKEREGKGPNVCIIPFDSLSHLLRMSPCYT